MISSKGTNNRERRITMKKLLCIILAITMCMSISGCMESTKTTNTEFESEASPTPNAHTPDVIETQEQTQIPVLILAENLMDGVEPEKVSDVIDLKTKNAAVTDFALRLLKASEDGEGNTLLSPLSVLCALSMTVNGAQGETLEEMESVLGMTRDELNLYIYTYIKNLPRGEKYKLSIANSIWLKDDESFVVNGHFLQTNANYYGADIYKTPFNEQTIKDINNWVSDKTDGMIPEIIDSFPDDTVISLINTLAFDAEWLSIYYDSQVRENDFTKEDGTKQKVEFMYDSVNNYLEDENATGFMRYYKGRKYAFVALLPKEGISVSDYISSLDGESLNKLLENSRNREVKTSIPKFETEYFSEMSDVLKSMGMNKAFTFHQAEFGGIGIAGEEPLRISRVIHKTYISVAEKGTKAGAAAEVDIDPEEGFDIRPKEVYLNRPFLYMIVDTENNIPFFIGTMMDVK